MEVKKTRSNILILTVFDKSALRQIEFGKGYKRIVLICKEGIDRAFCKSYVEKLVSGSIFVSTVQFTIDFMSVVYDVYSKIGDGDKNPVFFIVATGDSDIEKKLVEFFSIELKNRSMFKEAS